MDTSTRSPEVNGSKQENDGLDGRVEFNLNDPKDHARAMVLEAMIRFGVKRVPRDHVFNVCQAQAISQQNTTDALQSLIEMGHITSLGGDYCMSQRLQTSRQRVLVFEYAERRSDVVTHVQRRVTNGQTAVWQSGERPNQDFAGL